MQIKTALTLAHRMLHWMLLVLLCLGLAACGGMVDEPDPGTGKGDTEGTTPYGSKCQVSTPGLLDTVCVVAPGPVGSLCCCPSWDYTEECRVEDRGLIVGWWGE